jgi:Sulfotransferase domain
MVPDLDFYVLHLIRDPRAAAYSWLKKKPQPDTDAREHMVRFSPTKSSALWNSWNVSAEALWRRAPEKYLRLRYEDFVADPRMNLERILEFVGFTAELPLAGEREVMLGVSHTVSGNPNRFETGAVELRPDREWTDKMAPRHRALVTTLTFPLLKHYGY